MFPRARLTRRSPTLIASRSLALACACSVSVAAIAPRAFAVDKAACVDAYEQTQKLKKGGHLRDARKKAMICAQTSCPKAVQGDCAQWVGDLDAATPTIVLDVKDADGNDVDAVTVTLDGEPLTETIDGKAIAIDPGKHTLWFERKGSAPVELTIIAREGDKNRAVDVKLKPIGASKTAASDGATPPPSDATTGPTSDPAKATDDTGASGGSSEGAEAPLTGNRPTPTMTYVLGGVGIVGLLGFVTFGLMASSGRSDLDTRGCKPACAQDDVDAVKSHAHLADLSLGIGVVSLGVATVLYLTRSSEPAAAPTTAGTLRFDVAATPKGGQAWLSVAF